MHGLEATRMSAVRLFLILILFAGFPLAGEAGESIRTISATQADSMARIQVYYRNRVVPFHTVAHDVTLKLTGKTKVATLDEVRFVASLMFYPSDWAKVPLFKIKDAQLADSLGIKKNEMITIANLFDADEEYKLKNWYRGTDKGFDKAILDLDEKVEIILLLHTNSLFLPLEETDFQPISEKRVTLEIFYNKFGIVRWLFIAIFGCTLIALLYMLLKIGFLNFTASQALLNITRTALLTIYIFLAGVAVFNFVARWIIGGHIPLAGGEQVMMFMTMFLLMATVIFSFRKPWVALCALGMSGFTALVARISSNDPIVTSLSPALASPWLAFHVSVIMASYAVLIIILPLSVASEFLSRDKVRKLIKPVYYLNVSGVILLGIGIILGSLWAKGAWGSYWSWDPKENWAAVTLIAYAFPLLFKKYMISHPCLYNAILICAFIFMVITYYGVNYMSSLHSYGT